MHAAEQSSASLSSAVLSAALTSSRQADSYSSGPLLPVTSNSSKGVQPPTDAAPSASSLVFLQHIWPRMVWPLCGPRYVTRSLHCGASPSSSLWLPPAWLCLQGRFHFFFLFFPNKTNIAIAMYYLCVPSIPHWLNLFHP